jgi:mono/diheme cytochrome c family protein
MKKILKWLGILVGALLALVIVLVIVGTVRANGVLTKEWTYSADSIAIPTDSESIARGEYLVEHFMLCADCHGADLGGQDLFGDEGPGTLWAPNLTSGSGGIGGSYADADWLRSLRHGIRPNGENLIIMPAEFYTKVDAGEIGAVIAYLKTLPPVDRQIPARSLDLMPKAMLGLGVFPASELIPAYKINHDAAPLVAPAPGVTVEYGEYRAEVCKACHGPDLGGMVDGQTGDITPNLTPGGELSGWTEANFLSTLRTGVTPSGHELDPMAMPWERVGGADAADLEAIWLYLQSVPAVESPGS